MYKKKKKNFKKIFFFFLLVLLKWVVSLFQTHGQILKKDFLKHLHLFKTLHKNINTLKKDISKVCEENTFNLSYLSHRHTLPSLSPSNLSATLENDLEEKKKSLVIDLDILPPKSDKKRKNKNKQKK